MTQRERILRHLTDYGTLTRLEAFRDYGIVEAPARITELRQRGYDITTSYEYGKNRYGEPVKWAKWTLRRNNEQIQNLDG